MEIKLFGKSLFSVGKNKVDYLIAEATEKSKDDDSLPDFYERMGNPSEWVRDYAVIESSEGGAVAVPKKDLIRMKKKGPGRPKMDIKFTPKGLYEIKALNDESYRLNTDKKYVDDQIADFKDKLGLLKSQDYDMRNGVNEINSILVRFENRLKYSDHKTFFDEFPYTLSTKISEVLKNHDHLQIGKIGQFIADMPKEAVNVMKKFDAECKKLCNKKAVFYIIADKKDFRRSDNRKDPILLAQSPFAHAWQILGAWDKEMLLLEEL